MSSQAEFRTKKTTSQWVENKVDLILELPKPGHEYRFENVARQSEQFEAVRDNLEMEFLDHFSTLKEKGVITKEQYYYNEEESEGYHLWETSKEIYEYAKKIRNQRDTYPCGHSSGFRTIDPEKGIYECLYEHCDEQFGRAVVERVEF